MRALTVLVAAACQHSVCGQPTPAPPCVGAGDARLLIGLGAQLVRSDVTGAIIPGLSGASRAVASFVAANHNFNFNVNFNNNNNNGDCESDSRGGGCRGGNGRAPSAPPLPPPPVLYTGGYLCGVRYDCMSSSLLNPPNLTIPAYAHARHAFPSEASTFAALAASWVSPGADDGPLLEESAAGTDENAALSTAVATRLARYTFDTPDPRDFCLGVVTNLYHMTRALDNFRNATYNTHGLPAAPVYAEDWVALLPPRKGGVDPARPYAPPFGDVQDFDWITAMGEFYTQPVGGVQFNASLIVDIMARRRAGDLSVSVADALPATAAQYRKY